jgi:hypothetical protein
MTRNRRETSLGTSLADNVECSRQRLELASECLPYLLALDSFLQLGETCRRNAIVHTSTRFVYKIHHDIHRLILIPISHSSTAIDPLVSLNWL